MKWNIEAKVFFFQFEQNPFAKSVNCMDNNYHESYYTIAKSRDEKKKLK